MPETQRFRRRPLRIGGVTKDELLQRLTAHGIQLNDYARRLFADDRFTPSAEARTVEVAFVTLPELGLADGGTCAAILEAAAARDLAPCPLEVAPHLRLDHLDQPVGPYLTVASHKLRDDPEEPNGLYLRHREDGLWLRGFRADDDHVYPPDFTTFVFLSP